MALELSTPISVQPRGAPRFDFQTFEQVRDWAQAEIERWTPLVNAGLNKPLSDWRDEALNPVRELAGVARNAIDAGNNQYSPDIEAYLNQFANGPAIYSGSLIAAPIIAHIERSEFAAATMLIGQANQKSWNIYVDGSHFLGAEIIGAVLEGAIMAGAQKALIEAQKKSAIDIVQDFQKRFDDKVASFEAKIAALDTAADRQLKLVDASHDELLKRISLARKQTSMTRRWVLSAAKAGRDENQRLKDTYERQLQLAAPVKYWAKRSNWSLGSAIAGLVVFLLLSAAAAAELWLHLGDIRSAISTEGKVDISMVILLTPLVVLPIWFLRMIARFFSIGISESSDARLRTTMVSTFLALTKDINSKLSDAERIVILQALFRPSGQQQSDDEASSANLIELIAKAASSGK